MIASFEQFISESIKNIRQGDFDSVEGLRQDFEAASRAAEENGADLHHDRGNQFRLTYSRYPDERDLQTVIHDINSVSKKHKFTPDGAPEEDDHRRYDVLLRAT